MSANSAESNRPPNAVTYEYAIEADPGKCTASFPTFDTLEAVQAAASQPAMEREGLPLPRVLVRPLGGSWEPNCWRCYRCGEPDGCPICGKVSDDD